MSDRSDMARIGPLFLEEGQVAVQREGLEAGRIAAFILVLFVAIAVVVWASTGWFAAEADAVRASVAAEAEYPDRRLMDLEAERVLSRYEVLDRDQGIYRIPIERAMEVVARQAMPDSAIIHPIWE